MREYLHGGDIYTQEIEMDYSANISPLGLPAGVKEAVVNNLDSFCVYPDSRCIKLREALAEHHQVKADHIICGNGSADLIFQLAEALKPEKALLTAPSFQEYEQALKAAGTKIRFCQLKKEQGFALDRKAWEEMLDDGIEMAFLCNPNNPTGIPILKEDVVHMADECRKRGIFLAVDECFNEFLDEPEQYSVLKEEGEKDNVFILKAFTKLYAMAGFRLGYGICGNEDVLSAMEEKRQPWSVSGIAQAAGEAALRETAYVRQVRELAGRERKFLKHGLEQLGFQVFDSQANYIFFHVPDDGTGEDSLFYRLKKEKILIRSCGNYPGLENGYYRICVKDREKDQKLLAIMEKVRHKR